MYVGTYLDSKNKILKVAERNNGTRNYLDYPLILEYYVEDNDGYDVATNGKVLKKIELQNIGDIKRHRESNLLLNIKTYELNFNLTNKVLYKYYRDGKAPTLHKSYIDIEVDLAGAPGITIGDLIEKANCPINAVSIYNDWENIEYTFMLCPDTLTLNQASEICNSFPNTYLFDKEEELIKSMIKVLDDSDVISGWNSNGFDIPYIIRRTENLLGKGSSAGYCLWEIEPKEKVIEQFGKKNYEYDLIGKWSCDYLVLYKKHATSKKESYKLDNIAYDELGDRKVAYSGSLDNLYRENYKLFIEYNRQDTMLVKRLEDKLKYIDIHNRQAHDIKCPIEQTMGTVAWVDQAIINEAHDNNMKVADRVEGAGKEFEGIIPPGAYVPEPNVGFRKWIFSFDMNSLYPTTMRSLNLSPEMIVGQFNFTLTLPHLWNKIRENNMWKNVSKHEPDWGAAWGGDDVWGTLEYQEILKQSDTILEFKMENGQVITNTAKNFYDAIFNENSHLSLSASGTVFDTRKKGLLNIIFTRWYSDRKKFKKKKAYYETLADGVKIEDETFLNSLKLIEQEKNVSTPIEYDIKKLKELIENKDKTNLEQFIYDNNLVIKDGIVESKDKKYFEEQVNYWDLEQYVKKIQLNSSYGALLNSSSVFYDFRLGCSTTMSGRKVWQNLSSKANEILTGFYSCKGHCLTYGDTDSCYMTIDSDEFRAKYPNFDYSKDNVVKFADYVGDEINKSFPEYMKKTFNCTDEGCELQKAGREVVATSGLFVSKKRYALMVIDKDGFRTDVHGKPGKLKIMGLQIQRSDTPMIIRKLLKDMMMSLLTYSSRDKLVDIIKNFYDNEWSKLSPWEKGTPRAVNNLEMYNSDLKQNLKARVPGHVMASINWNRLVVVNGDMVSPQIKSGDKIVVCKLKTGNPYNMTSIALPRDINTIPQWFKELPFDIQSMEDSVVDKTMDSIFGVLNWGIGMKVINENNFNDFELTF